MNAHETHQDANLTPAGAGVASLPTVDAAAVLATHVTNARFVTQCFVKHEAGTLCMACYRPWQGDAETGGCTAVLLARRGALLEGRVIALEAGMWRTFTNALGETERVCRACSTLERIIALKGGHHADWDGPCWIGELLRAPLADGG